MLCSQGFCCKCLLYSFRWYGWIGLIHDTPYNILQFYWLSNTGKILLMKICKSFIYFSFFFAHCTNIKFPVWDMIQLVSTMFSLFFTMPESFRCHLLKVIELNCSFSDHSVTCQSQGDWDVNITLMSVYSCLSSFSLFPLDFNGIHIIGILQVLNEEILSRPVDLHIYPI